MSRSDYFFRPLRGPENFFQMQLIQENFVGKIIFFQRAKYGDRLFFSRSHTARLFFSVKIRARKFFSKKSQAPPQKVKWSVPKPQHEYMHSACLEYANNK